MRLSLYNVWTLPQITKQRMCDLHEQSFIIKIIKIIIRRYYGYFPKNKF